MVAKSNTANATFAATRRLDKVIESHRTYFSDWRSEKFDRSASKPKEASPPSQKSEGPVESES